MQTPADLDERFEPFDEPCDGPCSPALSSPMLIAQLDDAAITAGVRVGAGQS